MFAGYVLLLLAPTLLPWLIARNKERAGKFLSRRWLACCIPAALAIMLILIKDGDYVDKPVVGYCVGWAIMSGIIFQIMSSVEKIQNLKITKGDTVIELTGKGKKEPA
jgi:hypothetical protein